MRLIMVRHGETIANVQRLLQGHQPGKLTERGEEQVRRLALALAEERIDLIIASDSHRSVQTAEPIIATHPESIVRYDERARERSHGIFEGMPYGSSQKAARAAGEDPLTFQPPGGESVPQFRARLEAFFTDLLREERGKSVLLVSHGGFIASVLLHFLKKPAEEFMSLIPQNASITILDLEDEEHCMAVAVNDVKHLQST